ncbi:MAG: D-2-hydroxyacid dehydrogenase [Chloroflexota bacterium]
MATNPETEKIEVLSTLGFDEGLQARLRAVSPRLNFTFIRTGKAEEIPAEVWQRTEVLYTNWVLPQPELAPKLRWVQFHWAGIDHVIQSPLLNKTEVVATTLSGSNASQIAEYVLMMLLALGHHLPEMIAAQKRSEWPRDRWERFSPRELRGSTIGIVGYGSIGRQIARLLHDFGATILATKRDVMHPEDYNYMPPGMGDPEGNFVRRLYPPQALCSMFTACDAVVVTVPLTAETRGLIGSKALAALKSTAFLVDVSRGGVIDHAALMAALSEQRIAGAALDVFPEEPLPSDSPLWKMPNVLISPHMSGSTPHYDERAVTLFSENLQRYIAGQDLLNQYDPRYGY